MSIAGDVDGDGYDEILIGATFPYVDSSPGSTFLFRGGADDLGTVGVGVADIRFEGNDAQDASGMSVVGAGDVNGDGLADFVIGEHLSDATNDAGEACLVFGDDISGSVTLLGGSGAEDLQAVNGPGVDVVIGGLGSDVLRADGGGDVLRGAEGDDVLMVVDDEFLRVDGGLGVDTLELVGAMDLPYAALTRSRVLGVERIVLSMDSPSTLALSVLSILNLSDTSNTLVVDGDDDDELFLLPGDWIGPINVDGYREWSSASAGALRLRVGAGVIVTEL